MSRLTLELVDSVLAKQIADLLLAHVVSRDGSLGVAPDERRARTLDIAECAVRETDRERVLAAHREAGRRLYEDTLAAGGKPHTEHRGTGWHRAFEPPMVWGNLTPAQQNVWVARAITVTSAFRLALRGVEHADRVAVLAALAHVRDKDESGDIR